MNRRILLVTVTGVLVLLAHAPGDVRPLVAQEAEAEDSLVNNPDLILPRQRTDNNVQYSIREARKHEHAAIALERQGKPDDALERWREAMNRYEALRRDHLQPDIPANQELLVRADWVGGEYVYTETWIPLADYINSRYRTGDWPRVLREQLSLRQSAAGAELLRAALASGDEFRLTRCARFFQFSPAGRTALRMLAELALERGDAVLAVRWLEELQKSWADDYQRDAALQVMYVRACRDSGMNYRLGRELRRREREAAGGKVDIGGRTIDSKDAVAALTGGTAPIDQPELRLPGWLTQQGTAARDGIAPPVVSIGAMVDLDPAEGVGPWQGAKNIPGMEEQRDPYMSEERKALPIVFPVAHASGVFLHRIDDAGGNDEKIAWFRHGMETSPVMLEVPRSARYPARQPEGRRYYYSNREAERNRYRVMASTIARVRWELDQRESDLLFAVMGPGNPMREKGTEPSGNQIQSWDVTDDAKLRLTLPNKKVETKEEFNFLQHVVFKGAPLVRHNRLYIAGGVAEKDSVEIWLFCFDVTPKGDAAAGEGKLQWRVHLCSKRQESQPWRWSSEPVSMPEISSPSEQGGMLYVSTHAGANFAVDRSSGEVCWISRYGRLTAQRAQGWYPSPPVASGGLVLTTPYDFDLALVLDSISGSHWMEYPPFRKGHSEEYEHVLGVYDNRMIIQGRTRVYSVGLTDFRKGGERDADFGQLNYQTAEFGKEPIGRGVIAGDRVLVPFEGEIAFFDVRNGKLLTRSPLDGMQADKAPATLSVYCRGQAYRDEQGTQRHHPVTLTDPDTGNVYNAEHLRHGDKFKFPSGKTAEVVKETFVILATARRVYVYKANDK